MDNDYFSLFLKTLKGRLADQNPVNHRTPVTLPAASPAPTNTFLFQLASVKSPLAKCEASKIPFSNLRHHATSMIRVSTDDRMTRVRHRWETCRRLREARIARLRSRRRRFEDGIAVTVSGARMRGLLYARRIRHQGETASRRLQELLFECYGEIEKACRRSARCATAHRSDSDARMRVAAATLRWRVFLNRLEADSLGAFRLHDLDVAGEADGGGLISVRKPGEASWPVPTRPKQGTKLSATAAALLFHCKAQLHDVINSLRPVPFTFDVRIERCALVSHGRSNNGRGAIGDRKRHKPNSNAGSNCAGGRGNKRGLATNRPPAVATSDVDLEPLLGQLFCDARAGLANLPFAHAGSISVPEPGAVASAADKFCRLVLPGTLRLPRYPATDLLTGHVISWLSLYHTLPVDSRVYYCVEERMIRRQHELPGCLEQKRQPKAARGSPTRMSRGTCVSSAIIDFLATVYGGNATSANVRAVCGLRGGLHAAKLRWHVRRVDGRHRHHYLHHHRVKQSKQEEAEDQHGPSHLSTVSPDVLVAEAMLPCDQTLADTIGADAQVHGVGNGSMGMESLEGLLPTKTGDVCETTPWNVVTLHFAPAMVHHIIETDRFAALSRYFSVEDRASLNEVYPGEAVKRGALSTLFIAVPATPAASNHVCNATSGGPFASDYADGEAAAGVGLDCQGGSFQTPNPLLGACVMPLPDIAVDELSSTFVIRNTTTTYGPRCAPMVDGVSPGLCVSVPTPTSLSVLPPSVTACPPSALRGHGDARIAGQASPMFGHSLVYNLPRDVLDRAVAIDNRTYQEGIEFDRLAGGTCLLDKACEIRNIMQHSILQLANALDPTP